MKRRKFISSIGIGAAAAVVPVVVVAGVKAVKLGELRRQIKVLQNKILANNELMQGRPIGVCNNPTCLVCGPADQDHAFRYEDIDEAEGDGIFHWNRFPSLDRRS